MNRLAGVLGDRAAKNLYFARVGIDFDIDEGRRESRPDAARVDAGASCYRTASARELRCELLQRDRRYAVSDSAEGSLGEFNFVELLLEDLRRAFLELPDCILRSFVNRGSSGECHA